MAQVRHAHKALVLVQRQIFGGGDKSGGGRLRGFEVPDRSQPCVEIVVLIQRRGAVHPGADGQEFFPVGHDLLPVALVRFAEMDLLGRRAAGGGAEIRGFHQAVAVAVEVEHPCAMQREPAARLALRVQLDEMELVAGEVGDEGDEVILFHRVMEGDEEFILYPLHGQLVVFVGGVGVGDVQWGQSDAAATDHRLTGGVEHIPTDGADVELGAQQIGGAVPIDYRLALH